MTGTDTALVPAGIRCSDADRERTCERVRVAAGEGRLTMTELEERLSSVYAATYDHELAALTTDLPEAAAPQTGWWAILAQVRAQLAAELTVLLGRTSAPRRRRWMLAGTIVVLLLFVVGGIAGAVHGFGSDGHGIGPGGHGIGHDGFGRDHQFGD